MIPRSLVPALRWWCLACFAVSAGAAEIVEPPRVEAVSGTSAVVRWATEVPTGTRVHFGREANRLTQSVEGEVGMLHEATLTGLQPGTPYFFAVGTARRILATGQFTTAASAVAQSSPVSTSPIEKVRTLLGRWLGESSAPPPQPVPPAGSAGIPNARQSWGNPGSLPDHFARHGGDFRATSPEDYAAQAWQFRQRARSGALRVKIDDAGVQRVFDPATGAFAAYNADGTTKTFFKPGSPGYFDRQPGRLVRAITP